MTSEVKHGAGDEEAPGGNGILGRPPETSSSPAQAEETALDSSAPALEDQGDQAGGQDETTPEPETPLQTAERERDEYLDLAQRARAEFENYKRRSAGDVRAAELRGRGSLARELVPTVDNLERALLAAGIDPAGAGVDGEAPGEEVSAGKALNEGVVLVYRELLNTLQRAGVEAYEPSGERFDPSLHEAIASNPVEGVESGLIIETVEKGYRLGDAVLRPARVVVSA